MGELHAIHAQQQAKSPITIADSTRFVTYARENPSVENIICYMIIQMQGMI